MSHSLTDASAEDLAPESGGGGALVKPDIVSVSPQIHGDWVLFHPVYTEDELRAVQVRAHMTVYHDRSSMFQ